MGERLDVLKTYKLYIDGAFPRSESGRTTPVHAPRASGQGALKATRKDASTSTPDILAHVAKASRKDLRDAVEAARRAQPKWSDATAYLRGQILYRMAEMLEGKRDEFVDALALTEVRAGARASATTSRSKGSGAHTSRPRRAEKKTSAPTRFLSPADEVSLAIDRLVNYAGWADKFSQVVGCHNPAAGPYYNFTIPEATGVVAVLAPAQCPLLALVSLIAPPLCVGNTIVALGSETNPIVPAILGEVMATSDVPSGVVNILTGEQAELLPFIASHRDIDAVHAANLAPDATNALRAGIAENLKRVTTRNGMDWSDTSACQSPWWIEAFVEFKTIWHPASV